MSLREGAAPSRRPESVAVGFIRSSPEKSMRPSSPRDLLVAALVLELVQPAEAVVPGRMTGRASWGR